MYIIYYTYNYLLAQLLSQFFLGHSAFLQLPEHLLSQVPLHTLSPAQQASLAVLQQAESHTCSVVSETVAAFFLFPQDIMVNENTNAAAKII